MIDLIKQRLGIAQSVKVYDDDAEGYLEDCKAEMVASGVPKSLIDNEDDRVVTAATLYVKAHLGNDRTDTEKYMKLYREKVFRLTLEEEDDAICGTEASV